MDWKLELVILPVSDVDRAKAFYTEKIGFHADHDHRVNEKLRFVQLTPPGSACSIAFGRRDRRPQRGPRAGPADGRDRRPGRARRVARAWTGGRRGPGPGLGLVHLLQGS